MFPKYILAVVSRDGLNGVRVMSLRITWELISSLLILRQSEGIILLL